MTDIKQAIQELRSLIDNEPVEIVLIHSAIDRLASSVEGGTVEPIGYALWCEADESIWECVLSDRDDADCRCAELRQTTGFKFEVLAIYASPTPDLTSRIEAAADEIADISLDARPTSDEQPYQEAITAILRRHIEGGR